MLSVVPFGLDYGNTDTCAVVAETQTFRSQVLPSAISLGSLSELATKRAAIGDPFERDTDALASDEYVIELGGSEYFIGKLALSESKTAQTGRGDVTRYWSQRALAMLLASASVLLPIDMELHVVTGLPVETFSKTNRQKVQYALEGEYHFVFRGRMRHALVIVERVVMEGAGALVLHGTTQDALQGVIDIGGRTTDLYAAQGQRPITELCKGIPLGVEAVTDRMSARFAERYERPLKMSERQHLLRAWVGSAPWPTLHSHGIPCNTALLEQWMDAAINEVANEIISFIAATWNTSEKGAVAADIAPLLLIGGGAYYFTRHIRSRIGHVLVPANPERANAEGYAALARALVRQRQHQATA